MCEVWMCCLLVTTLTLQMHFFWYGDRIIIEFLWLELLSGEFASCYPSTILHITKDDCIYFPLLRLKLAVTHRHLCSQCLISEVIDIGVFSTKAEADDKYRSHTIDLAIFREKVISNRKSYVLSMTLRYNQVHN